MERAAEENKRLALSGRWPNPELQDSVDRTMKELQMGVREFKQEVEILIQLHAQVEFEVMDLYPSLRG